MKQITVEPLFTGNELLELKTILNDEQYKEIAFINQSYIAACMINAFGVKFEDTKVNEKTLLTKVYYSIPELYETDWFSDEDNVDEILKSLIVDYMKAQYKLLALKEEEIIEEDELKMLAETMTKYYCKTRTGECWTEEKSQNEIDKYIKETKEKVNVIFDKFSGYKEV